MDRIFIKDLMLRCILGVGREERREKQDIIVNLELMTDLRAAGKSDRIEETVDYSDLKKRVVAMVERSQYTLVETLAERIAAVCLACRGIEQARVAVEKPTVLRFARSVGVELVRTREELESFDAFIGVGSNIDPENNIRRGLEFLGRRTPIVGVSTFYETEPLGKAGGPAFWNGVVRVETRILPAELKYGVLRPIEEELGRRRSEDKNAARTLDLDLLLYGDLVVRQDNLTVPDPEIGEREFLAVPLCELAPELVLPDSRQPIRECARRFEKTAMKPLTDFTASLRKEFRP